VPERGHPGQPFYVIGHLDNPGDIIPDAQVYFALEVFGEFWFWDDWIHYAPPEANGIDFRLLDIPSGSSQIEVIPEFIWPDTGQDEVEDLHFYGAMIDPAAQALLGRLAVVTWGYGP